MLQIRTEDEGPIIAPFYVENGRNDVSGVPGGLKHKEMEDYSPLQRICVQHSLYFPHIRSSGKKRDQLISFKIHHEEGEQRQLLHCILYKSVFQTAYSNSTQFSVNAKLERTRFFSFIVANSQTVNKISAKWHRN